MNCVLHFFLFFAADLAKQGEKQRRNVRGCEQRGTGGRGNYCGSIIFEAEKEGRGKYSGSLILEFAGDGGEGKYILNGQIFSTEKLQLQFHKHSLHYYLLCREVLWTYRARFQGSQFVFSSILCKWLVFCVNGALFFNKIKTC